MCSYVSPSRLGAAVALEPASEPQGRSKWLLEPASEPQRDSKWLPKSARSRSRGRSPGCAHTCLLLNTSLARPVRIFWFPPLFRRTAGNFRRGDVCLCAIQRSVFSFSDEMLILKSESATFHANLQKAGLAVCCWAFAKS